MQENIKYKICFLISSLCNEGPVNVMLNTLRFIDYSNFDVSVITLIPEKKSSKIDDFKKLPIKIYQISPEKKINLLLSYFKLRRLIKKIDPQIIHGHCSRPLYLMSFLPKKYKTVYTIHTYPGICNIAISGKYKGRIIIALDNFFTKWCNKAICCSQNISDSYLTEKNIKYKAIPNGASFPIWVYNEKEKSMLRKEFKLKADWKYFVFIGRFSSEKSPDALIPVFKKLEKSKIGLVMLGDGPLMEDCKRHSSNNIVFVGFTNRVNDYLKACDYYISSSEIEGLANTILENLSVGLPMVLSDIPAHHEILSNFMDSSSIGVLMNKNDVDDVVSKIQKIQAFNVESSQLKMHEVYKREYTAEIMSKRYQNVYISLIKQQ